MLEKLISNPRIDKVRIIQILEADFNGLLGILWNQRLMKHAILHDAINPNQWACPGCSAINTVIMKHLSYSVFHLTHTGGASFDNDAKACYDCIVSFAVVNWVFPNRAVNSLPIHTIT